MRTLALSLLILSPFVTGVAHARYTAIRGSAGSAPICRPAPVAVHSVSPTLGCWRDVSGPVDVPGRWITVHGESGRSIRTWDPAHQEVPTERVWVDARGIRDEHEHRPQGERSRRNG